MNVDGVKGKNDSRVRWGCLPVMVVIIDTKGGLDVVNVGVLMARVLVRSTRQGCLHVMDIIVDDVDGARSCMCCDYKLLRLSGSKSWKWRTMKYNFRQDIREVDTSTHSEVELAAVL